MVDWRSAKLRPRSSVAVVAIAKAAIPAAGHGGFGYGDNPWPLPTAGHNRVDGPSLLATVRLDGIFTADSENAYLSSVNFHGG